MARSLFEPPVTQLTVLYDEDCGFCRWTADQLRSLDRRGRLEFVPLQHAADHPERPALARLAANHPLKETLHVLRRDGRVRQGGGAMLEILDALPGGWLLRPWAAIAGVEAAVHAAYTHLAHHRSAIGRLVARGGPTPAACDLHRPHVT